MILCKEKPKYSSRKLLELINEHSKFKGYKINIQWHLWKNKEHVEKEIMKTIPWLQNQIPENKTNLGS